MFVTNKSRKIKKKQIQFYSTYLNNKKRVFGNAENKKESKLSLQNNLNNYLFFVVVSLHLVQLF